MIIGLAGPMAVGKDHVAAVMAGVNPRYQRRAFADKLKEVCAQMFPWLGSFYEKTDQKRAILQQVGMALRAIDPEVWVKHLLWYEERALVVRPDVIVIVPDVRFPNEARMVEERGILVRVHCEEWLQRARLANLYPDMDQVRRVHESETALTAWPFQNVIDSTTHESLGETLAVFLRRHGLGD